MPVMSLGLREAIQPGVVWLVRLVTPWHLDNIDMFKRKSWSLYKGCVSIFFFLCWRSVLWASWTTTDSLVQGMACQLISISKHGFTKLSWLIIICCRDACKSKRTRYSKDYYRHLIWLKRLLAHLFMKLVNMVQKKTGLTEQKCGINQSLSKIWAASKGWVVLGHFLVGGRTKYPLVV